MDAIKDYLLLRRFIPSHQMSAMVHGIAGQEGVHFQKKFAEVSAWINGMPATGQTDGQGDDAIVHLHYFGAFGDYWITEKDVEKVQHQAFGFACLNGMADCAELGYISIAELLPIRGLGAPELDLYWTKKPLREIRESLAKKLAGHG